MTTYDNFAGSAALRLGGVFNRFFAGIREGFEAYVTARSRIAEIERLNCKSDAALAEMGLKREDIARHVFRDLLHI